MQSKQIKKDFIERKFMNWFLTEQYPAIMPKPATNGQKCWKPGMEKYGKRC